MSKTKKILIISDNFPDKYNHMSGIFVAHQVNELSFHYIIKVIATCFPHEIQIEQSKTKSYDVTYVFYPLFKNLFLSAMYYYQKYAIPVIKSTIREWKPDIIHVHDFRHIPELYLLNKCLNKFGIPRFLTANNVRTHPSMIKSSRFKWFYGLTFRSSYRGWTKIFTVNDKLKDFFSKFINPSCITNIGNAIGPVPEIEAGIVERYRELLSSSSFKIISVGNLKKEKGFSILIQAIGMLINKGYSIQALIIGKGEEKESLQSEIRNHGLEDKVILTGDLKNEVVRNLYGLFDAFVLPSYSETFGIVYIEAMYAGIPAIGVKGQGIDGVIKNGENGLLVNPEDADDLADKIEYLIKHKDEVRAMAEKGQKMVQNEFQLSQLIGRIIKVYEQ